MTYLDFKHAVEESELTLEMLRCDVPPNEPLLAFMNEVGLERYEDYVLRYESEVTNGSNSLSG